MMYDADVCVVEKMGHEASSGAVKKVKSETRTSFIEQQPQTKTKQKSSSDSVAIGRDSADTGNKLVQVTYFSVKISNMVHSSGIRELA